MESLTWDMHLHIYIALRKVVKGKLITGEFSWLSRFFRSTTN